MVQIVDGALPSTGLLTGGERRTVSPRFRQAIVAGVALAMAAALLMVVVTPSATTELFEYEHDGGHSGQWKGTTSPAELTDDQVKNIWADGDHAWKDIDMVLPTVGTAWQDQSDPAVGYKFSNPGSVTSDAGFTGYYDTSLRDGTDVFPNQDADTGVNDILGYDPVLNGGNALWGRKGGNTVEAPQAWSHVEPMNIATMSDGDYVPYSWVNGGASHSAIGVA